jgi:hypothetical protein
MDNQTDDAVVKYGVKELLALQNETLKRVESKIDANHLVQAEVNAKIDTRVSLLESTVAGILKTLADNKEYRRWLIPVLLTVIYTAISVTTFVLAH